MYPVLESEALLLLDNLREFPADFISILRRSVGRTIVRVAYGHGGDGGEDYIDLAEVAQDNFSRAATPYTYMVDYVPIRERHSVTRPVSLLRTAWTDQ